MSKAVGEKAVAKGIQKRFASMRRIPYHGRVKELADGAREAGLHSKEDTRMHRAII